MKTSIKLTFILILIGIFFNPIFCETIAEPPSNFNELNAGTVTNPFLISNLANLRWLSETPKYWGSVYNGVVTKYYFIQTADIDATATREWNDGNGFRPIGSLIKQLHGIFRGDYDGGSFKVSNLFIGDGEEEYVGFFGYIAQSTIKNIDLDKISIILTKGSKPNVAPLVGYIAGTSTILDCSSTGEIIIFNNVNVTGGERENISGLVSCDLAASRIQRCFSTVKIVDHREMKVRHAGLVGYMFTSKLIDSYYYGIISNEKEHDASGGLSTDFFHDDYSYIKNCYVAGVSEFSKVNNFIGTIRKFNSIPVYNSFWDKEVTGIAEFSSTSDFGSEFGLTTAEMKQASTFINAGWDFNKVWAIDPTVNNGYPYLQRKTINVTLSPSSFSFGNIPINHVSEQKTFTITNKSTDDLLVQSITISGENQFILTNNNVLPIKLSEFQSAEVSVSYAPTVLGTSSAVIKFVDSDNKSYTIALAGESLTVSEPPSNFNELNAGTASNPFLISNLANLKWFSETTNVQDKGYHFVLTSNIDATETNLWNKESSTFAGFKQINNFVGVFDGNGYKISKLYGNGLNSGIFKYVQDSKITNLNLEDIYLDRGYSSLARYVSNSVISYCHISGEIKGTIEGGLISESYDTVIEYCSVTADIKFNSATAMMHQVGGIVGKMNGGKLSNSFFNGNFFIISGSAYFSGLSGVIINSSDLEKETFIENCYATTRVLPTTNWVYGLVRENYGTHVIYSITNNFWDVNTMGTDLPCAMSFFPNGLGETNYGLTTQELKQSSTYINAGWDFNNVWEINPVVNNGYPFLKDKDTEIYYPEFSITPSSKNFGELVVYSTSEPQIFTITNTGTGNLMITSISIDGKNSDQFVIEENNHIYPILIPANTSIDVSVVYAPTKPGNRTAELKVVDNLQKTLYSIPLSGKGVMHSPSNFTYFIQGNSVTLSWEKPRDVTEFHGFIGYHVYRDDQLLVNEPIMTESHSDANVPSGVYKYSLIALYKIGESEHVTIEEVIVNNLSTDDVPSVHVTMLYNNYPNPFNPTTTIQFEIRNSESGISHTPVSIDIFNVKGQKIRSLVNGNFGSGVHQAVWNGKDDSGNSMGSSIYFYRMTAGEYTATKKMILMK